MKKKLFSILLSLTMVVTMMPMMTMTAFAGESHAINYNGENLNFYGMGSYSNLTLSGESGDEVSFKVWVNEGYALEADSLKATYGSTPTELTLTQDTQDSTKYTFIMPDSEVYVTATATATGTTSNWLLLKKALSGQEQATVDSVFTVSENTPGTGTRTIKLLTDIASETGASALVVTADKNIVLDLNGHVLNRAMKSDIPNGYVIKVENGAKLTVKDSNTKTEHKGYVDASGIWHWDSNSTHVIQENEIDKTINGGIITGGKNTYGKVEDGGAGVKSEGDFTLQGGNIAGNGIYNQSAGGGVYVSASGTFTMAGGNIAYNSVVGYNHGGGVYLYKDGAKFTMTGGSINSNTVAINFAGGVYVPANDIFTMTGGTITDNYAKGYGGGIYALSGATVNIGGTAVIRGNSSNTIQESNLHLKDSSKEIVKLSTDKPLKSGAEIGITVYSSNENDWKPGVEVGSYFGTPTGLNDTNYKYFIMTNSGSANKGTIYGITKDGSNYVLASSFKVEGYTGEHGKVTPEKNNYINGETVSLGVTPNEGYELDALTYTPSGEAAIDITSTKSFTMPAKAVTINATFKEKTDDPTPGPSGGDTPADSGTEEYTIPVKGEGAVQVETTITNGNAEVQEITKEKLEEVIKPREGGETTDTIKIDLSNAKQKVKGVELTKSSIENLAEVVVSKGNKITTVEIALTNATVSLDAKALNAISKQANGDSIQLVVDDKQSNNLNTTQQSSLKDLDVKTTFEAYFESNGQRIHDFKGGIAIVSLKFETEARKNANNYKVYYVAENGKLQKYATKYADGFLKFATTHFSDYAIVYDPSVDVLLLKAKASGKKAVKLSWNGIDNAKKYVIYGAKCGKKYKKIKTVKGKSYTVNKLYGNKLKAHKSYKFYVVAYDTLGSKVKSKTIHFVTANTQGKYANVKSIKAMKKGIDLGIGTTAKIEVKYKMYAGKNHLKKGHGAALRYISNNPEIAAVSSNGNVTAVGKGTATIYIQDIGGKYCKTKVTVK